jgi:4-hydroxy-tetrahydrodipicolinate reductase
VAGTTGWHEQLPEIQNAVLQRGTALVWAANFSIGVNLFLQSVAHAASLFASHSEYEAWGWELHHSEKKDAPSGTLKKLSEEVKAAGYNRPISLSANRAGANPGTHEIGFDSAEDTITFRHTARNREGFARGALKAAQWVAGKKGVFQFSEILGQLETEKLAVSCTK